ncbi:hypothetical protein [Pseudalkalibacillus caeni]|uniref:hypothetical protein n=1 Tax=Exobacillus caeni TaxID=2574798 RepID=UPI00148589F3|nr:hypothetical protein [Pseudalkalibacillus caeni]
MSPQLKNVLERYIEYLKGLLGDEYDQVNPLFITRRYQRWNRINRRTIQDIFNNYARKARINNETL